MSHPADVIVIGAGIIGCAVARELARRGAAVSIVDDRGVGLGATHASAGILAPYIETRSDDPLFPLTVRSLSLYDDFVAEVVAESGTPVPYRRTGTLEVAADEAGLAALQTAAALWGRCGVVAELVDARDARGAEPHLSAHILGGLLIPAHGFVSANDLTRATAAAAQRLGVRIEQRRATRVARVPGGMVVDTDAGTLRGDAVVLAAGSWSGAIEIDGVARELPVTPVRGQLLRLSWNGPPLRRILWSSRCYLVPWDDGTLLVGATLEQAGFDERTTVAGVRDLLDAACEIAPHTWTAGFLAARAGLRPGTVDDLPIIGSSGAVQGLMYATGHYRNGVLLAPLTAQLVADAMIDNRVDAALEPFGPTRFGDL